MWRNLLTRVCYCGGGADGSGGSDNDPTGMAVGNPEMGQDRAAYGSPERGFGHGSFDSPGTSGIDADRLGDRYGWSDQETAEIDSKLANNRTPETRQSFTESLSDLDDRDNSPAENIGNRALSSMAATRERLTYDEDSKKFGTAYSTDFGELGTGLALSAAGVPPGLTGIAANEASKAAGRPAAHAWGADEDTSVYGRGGSVRGYSSGVNSGFLGSFGSGRSEGVDRGLGDGDGRYASDQTTDERRGADQDRNSAKSRRKRRREREENQRPRGLLSGATDYEGGEYTPEQRFDPNWLLEQRFDPNWLLERARGQR